MPKDPFKAIYIRGWDYTLTTSRNGHAALFAWDYLMRKSLSEHIEEAVQAYNLANYLHEKLLAIQRELNIDLNIYKSKIGLNIKFKKPSDELCYKYGLLVMEDIALIFIMPDKKKDLVDCFL